MSTSYPLMIDVSGKNIVVFGGGKIAERKVKSFIHTGARIKVISPTLSAPLHGFVQQGKIRWKKKHFQRDDIFQAFFVIAATNDPRVNREIVASCTQNQLVLNVSEGKNGNVTMPALLQHNLITIAVSTNGTDPVLAKKLRDKLAVTINHVITFDGENDESTPIINDA